MTYILISSIFIILITNKILIHKNYLLNYTGFKHQKFTSTGYVPLSGGIILITLSFFYIDIKNFFLPLSLLLIFLTGFFSDIKKLNSPLIRLLFQILVIFFSIYFTSISVETTRIILIDQLLKNYLFQLIFSVFCVVIIINGTNFIDGLNTLVIGYYLIILLILIKLENEGILISQIFDLFNFIYVLLVLYLFNFFGKLYLGDGGSYFLGFVFSIFLIETSSININISPFFIVSLLWYPAFENLFSIIRKIKFSRSPVDPDINHLHQLIFNFLHKNLRIKSQYLNSFSAIMINSYNAMMLFTSSIFYSNSQIQILIISLNVTVYTFIYIKLIKYKLKKN